MYSDDPLKNPPSGSYHPGTEEDHEENNTEAKPPPPKVDEDLMLEPARREHSSQNFSKVLLVCPSCSETVCSCGGEAKPAATGTIQKMLDSQTLEDLMRRSRGRAQKSCRFQNSTSAGCVHPWQTLKTHGCDYKGKQAVTHETECAYRPIPCPLRCGEEMSAFSMAFHLIRKHNKHPLTSPKQAIRIVTKNGLANYQNWSLLINHYSTQFLVQCIVVSSEVTQSGLFFSVRGFSDNYRDFEVDVVLKYDNRVALIWTGKIASIYETARYLERKGPCLTIPLHCLYGHDELKLVFYIRPRAQTPQPLTHLENSMTRQSPQHQISGYGTNPLYPVSMPPNTINPLQTTTQQQQQLASDLNATGTNKPKGKNLLLSNNTATQQSKTRTESHISFMSAPPPFAAVSSTTSPTTAVDNVLFNLSNIAASPTTNASDNVLFPQTNLSNPHNAPGLHGISHANANAVTNYHDWKQQQIQEQQDQEFYSNHESWKNKLNNLKQKYAKENSARAQHDVLTKEKYSESESEEVPTRVKRKRKYEPTASSDPNVFVFDGLPPKDTDHGKKREKLKPKIICEPKKKRQKFHPQKIKKKLIVQKPPRLQKKEKRGMEYRSPGRRKKVKGQSEEREMGEEWLPKRYQLNLDSTKLDPSDRTRGNPNIEHGSSEEELTLAGKRRKRKRNVDPDYVPDDLENEAEKNSRPQRPRRIKEPVSYTELVHTPLVHPSPSKKFLEAQKEKKLEEKTPSVEPRFSDDSSKPLPEIMNILKNISIIND